MKQFVSFSKKRKKSPIRYNNKIVWHHSYLGLPWALETYPLITNAVSKILEKLIRDFLWERVDKRKGPHHINLEVVFGLLDLGLGINNVRARNKAFLVKWLKEIYHDYDTLWYRVIITKYGLHPVKCTFSPSLGFHHLVTIWETQCHRFVIFSCGLLHQPL